MDPQVRRELDQLGAITLAAIGLAEMVVKVMHDRHPGAFEDELRSLRLMVQEAATDRSLLEDQGTLPSWRMQLRALERALDRSPVSGPPAPAPSRET